jgi:hypothetical protein
MVFATMGFGFVVLISVYTAIRETAVHQAMISIMLDVEMRTSSVKSSCNCVGYCEIMKNSFMARRK